MTFTSTDLKDYRKYFSLSQRALAQIVGVSKTFVALLESGERNMPSYVPERLGVTYELLQNIRSVKMERIAMYQQYQK